MADLALRALDFVERLDAISDIDELGSALVHLIEPLGLTAAVCGVTAGPLLAAGRRFLFVRWPGDWLDLYQKENFAAIDPVPRLVQATGRAATFSAMIDAMPLKDPGRRVIEAGASFRFSEGMLVPVAMPDGSTGLVSVAGDRDRLSATERAFIEIVAAATLRRAAQFEAPSPMRPLPPALTRRELDCLGLLVRGLGDRDIASKLGVSERTVRFHLDSARSKTGSSSRTHLAAVAMWLGLARL